MKLRALVALLALTVAGCSGGNNDSGSPQASPSAVNQESPPASVAETESPSATPSASETPEPSKAKAMLNMEGLNALFGFADEQGTKLMALTDEMESGAAEKSDLKGYKLAIGEGGGQVLSIRYANHQDRSEQDNGRQSMYNFDNMAGDIYAIEEGKATPNESYILVSPEQFDIDALIPLKPAADRALPDDIAKKIAEEKERAIEQGWLLAHAQDGQRIYVVQFERQGENMLASLVWQEGERLVFMDYPATYNDNSAWRVDDGGEISPEMFRFLFAARSADDGIVLGVQWMGAEGENLNILSSSGERFEKTEISGGRYLSPI